MGLFDHPLIRALAPLSAIVALASGLAGLGSLIAHSPATALHVTLMVSGVAAYAFALAYPIIIGTAIVRQGRWDSETIITFGVMVLWFPTFILILVLLLASDPGFLAYLGIATLPCWVWGAVATSASAVRKSRSSRKFCPECAEQIRAEAIVCRYCGYRYLVADRMSP